MIVCTRRLRYSTCVMFVELSFQRNKRYNFGWHESKEVDRALRLSLLLTCPKLLCFFNNAPASWAAYPFFLLCCTIECIAKDKIIIPCTQWGWAFDKTDRPYYVWVVLVTLDTLADWHSPWWAGSVWLTHTFCCYPRRDGVFLSLTTEASPWRSSRTNFPFPNDA